MRVTVTGATGFIGAHVAHALDEMGHELDLLVRNPDKVPRALDPLDVTPAAIHVGDITDRDAVASALDGADAVVHCAAKVSLDRADADDMISTNVSGTQNVLGMAVELGLDPVVHLSSITAVFPPVGDVLRADDPVTEGLSAYGRSKALCETYARSLQEQHPLTIFYPGGVIGPHCAGSYELVEGLAVLFRTGIMPIARNSHTTLIDVRDLARGIALAIEPGRGPRRYMAGGRWVSFEEWVDLLGAAGGRRLRVPQVPGAVLRGTGRLFESYARMRKSEPLMTYEQAVIMSQAAPTDDSALFELGVDYRPLEETIADFLRWAVAEGHIASDDAPEIA